MDMSSVRSICPVCGGELKILKHSISCKCGSRMKGIVGKARGQKVGQ
ncbi:hypothetical protein ACFSVM_01820 [Paenibacillus shunpengii]|uniref:Uncharacterized protein n=1 Tax=Paenibacillus shunpengii TaxID=2054424 RepID=A0ABW5SII1_9BACL|nr:hypothetical protein [Paenibacillus sp. FSL H7-0326]